MNQAPDYFKPLPYDPSYEHPKPDEEKTIFRRNKYGKVENPEEVN